MRRAGTGRLDWGGQVTWTVADGRRGRRWRSMLVDDGQLVGALLIETSPDGAVTKLEVASAAGLLTLHPEGDTLHGNVARPTGMAHVTLPWRHDGLLLAVGTPATAAVAAHQLGGRIGAGEGRTLLGVSVDVGLHVVPTTFRVARIADRRWRFLAADTGIGVAVELDDDGIPVLADGASWPLEADHDH